MYVAILLATEDLRNEDGQFRVCIFMLSWWKRASSSVKS